MTEARDIEEILAEWERETEGDNNTFSREIRAIAADWRAKKEEIERLESLTRCSEGETARNIADAIAALATPQSAQTS